VQRLPLGQLELEQVDDVVLVRLHGEHDLSTAPSLSEHGAQHGLCQIYSNEPWHYELRPEAIDHG
jgi:hypothetical protein